LESLLVVNQYGQITLFHAVSKQWKLLTQTLLHQTMETPGYHPTLLCKQYEGIKFCRILPIDIVCPGIECFLRGKGLYRFKVFLSQISAFFTKLQKESAPASGALSMKKTQTNTMLLKH
jgi:hypothetical protein